jgi:hypothetical protein
VVLNMTAYTNVSVVLTGNAGPSGTISVNSFYASGPLVLKSTNMFVAGGVTVDGCTIKVANALGCAGM